MRYNGWIVKKGTELILEGLGLNLKDVHLKDTPMRVARAYRTDICKGYYEDVKKVLRTEFPEKVYNEMITVRDIEFYSTCSHHLLPFSGTVTVSYLPKKKVIGLSKIIRLVEMYSRRLQVQERLTCEIADALQTYLKPKGCGVHIRAKHLCTCARGVKTNNLMVTTALRGQFLKKEVKTEFLEECR